MGPTLMSYLRGASVVGTGAGTGDVVRAATAGRDWPAIDEPTVGAAAISGLATGLTMAG